MSMSRNVDTRQASRHRDGGVLPRLTASVLSVVLGFASVLASPAACAAQCPVAQGGQAACCKRGTLGVTAPPCCGGVERFGGRSGPATAERGRVDVRPSLASIAVPMWAPEESPRTPPRALDAGGTSPPGRGPLIRQRTSLLL
jgi:hypothetical protein